MKKLPLFFVIIPVLFVSIAFAQSLQPGVWKGEVKFKVNGIPLPATEDEDCILPHEAKDVKGSIVKNLKKKGCVLNKWDVKGQNLNATLTCKSDELDAKGSLKGRFSHKDYKLKGEAEGTYKDMLPAVASIEMEGKWVKSCQN